MYLTSQTADFDSLHPLDASHTAVLSVSAWQQCTNALPLNEKNSVIIGRTFEQLKAAHAEPQRKYHTAAHINACINWVYALHTQLENPNQLILAFFFHDAVYEPTRADNELQSAQWAIAFLEKFDVPQSLSNWVYDAIMATQSHALATAYMTAPDMAFFLDIDMSIIGSETNVYAAYTKAIRQEYAHVDNDAYRTGRTRVLHHFLEQADNKQLYKTSFFREKLLSQAYQNIQWELDQLA